MLYLLHRYNPLFDFMFKPLKSRDDITVVEVSSHFNPLLRWVKTISVKVGLVGKWPQKQVFRCTPFPKGLKPEDTVLLFDLTTTPMVKWLEKHLTPGKLSIFLWNTIEKPKKYLFRKGNLDICTFDFKDAEKYRLRLVKQMYRHPDNTGIEPVYDFFYIASDKGRIQGVERLMENLQNLGYSTKCLMKSPTAKPEDYTHIEIIKSFKPYEEVLDLIARSRILMDITQEIQTGFTLRPMEGLFFGKKVITNNKSILSFELYDPSRFFVIDGMDFDPDKMKKFIEMPYKPVDQESLQSYDITHWITQFMH